MTTEVLSRSLRVGYPVIVLTLAIAAWSAAGQSSGATVKRFAQTQSSRVSMDQSDHLRNN